MRRRSRSCWRPDTPITANATAEDVKAYKQLHGSDRGFRGAAEDSGAVRLRVPDEGHTVVDDIIRGETAFPNSTIDDPVIARADGSVLYNFAVAVDDLDAQITHVVRGEDHLSNTPKQLLVFEALGAQPPRYAHLPLLHGPDGKKLSKRHGAASVQELRAAGYLPEAVDNYIALLGAGFAADEEHFSLEELAERFRLERVSKNPAIFDERKLRHINGRHMRELGIDELTRRLEHYTGASGLRDAVAISAEKIQTLADFWPLAGFLFDGPADDPAAFAKVLGRDGGRGDARGRACGARGRRAVQRRARREGAARTWSQAAGCKPGRGVPAGARRDRRHDGLAGDLRKRRAARARGDARTHRSRAAKSSEISAEQAARVRAGAGSLNHNPNKCRYVIGCDWRKDSALHPRNCVIHQPSMSETTWRQQQRRR